MKASQIKPLGIYTAKVSNNLTQVQVNQIRTRRSDGRTVYEVTNLKTGRKTTFESAAKFRSEATKESADDKSGISRRDSQNRSKHRNSEATTANVPEPVTAERKTIASVDAGEVNPTPVPAANSHLSGLAAKLQQRQQVSHPHLIIEARAGTGKTTTLIEGLKYMRGLSVSITPSPQQQAVWDQLKLSADAQSVCFVAFNKSIATELQ